MTQATIRLERHGDEHVRIVLARPQHKNALGIPELQSLARAVESLTPSPPRVLSLLAEGSAFGVGGDIQAFGDALDQGEMDAWLQEAIGHFNRAISGLRALDTAIVVGVQGAVAGGTLGLVWAADHVIVANDLALNLAYARLGGSPDGGTSWFLPRLVNHLQAFELFSLASSVGAADAVRYGIANKAVPVAELGGAVDQVVASWLAVPEQSLRNFKALLRASEGNTLCEQLRQEQDAFVLAGRQAEFARRVKVFLDGKRRGGRTESSA